MEYNQFFVGTTAFVIKGGEILLGKRKNVFGAGSWGLPGGHLELNESMQKAVARELYEETGLRCKSFEFLNIVNDPQGKKHYLQICFLAKNVKGVPTVKEVDKCEEWKYFSLNKLPKNVLPSHKKQIQTFLKKKNFTDSK